MRLGITHSLVISNWIGDVLNRVVKYCDANGTPHLSSLVVQEDGLVGDGYLAVIGRVNLITGRLTLDELDDHAAKERLECYRYFGAELPPDGGRPSLTHKAKPKRDDKKAEAKREAPLVMCGSCNQVLPSTGQCDYCD